MARVKDLPEEDRPREKAISHGISSLSESELLALIISSGIKGKSAIEIAYNLLSTFHGLYSLSKSSLASIKQVSGLSVAKSLSLLASFELSKRIERAEYEDRIPALDPRMIYEKYKDAFKEERKECALILMMDKKGNMLKEKKIYQGNKDKMLFSTKEVIVELLVNYSDRFILLHNHPSGNPLPSQDDIRITMALKDSGKELGIIMEDHIIFSEQGYFSFHEAKLV